MTLLRFIDYIIQFLIFLIISKDVIFDENLPLHNIRGKKWSINSQINSTNNFKYSHKSTKLKKPNESIWHQIKNYQEPLVPPNHMPIIIPPINM